MAHTKPNSHLPYAIRYMARLQEQAAQASASASEDKSAERLQRSARHLRTVAGAFTPANGDDLDAAAVNAPQKIKLLNFLRHPAAPAE